MPREILYDRMKTAVIGEDDEGSIVYNRALIDFARHYGFQPKACRPYRAKTKGKVERPFRYIREDFFLARSFRNLDDLNAQLRHWLDTVANPRVHATTAASSPRPSPRSSRTSGPAAGAVPLRAQARTAGLPRGHGLRRRQSLQRARRHPQRVSSRCTRSPTSADLRGRQLIAAHPVLEGRSQRRIAPGHRKMPPPANGTTPAAAADPARPAATAVARAARLLRGRRPAAGDRWESAMTDLPRRPIGSLDRIRRHLVGLQMPRALEVLDHTVRRLERGEISALEAIDTLLAEELTLRENRRVKTALQDGQALDHQDAGRLRLLLPAVARPQPDPGARPARLHRPRRGRPLPRAARHRQEPSRHRARRRGGQGRPQRLLRHPGRHRRRRSPRPSAKASCASGSASSAGPRSSSSTRSATCRSSTAAATCSSSSSTPATRGAP